jgi:DNA-binding NtrC family response regulator
MSERLLDGSRVVKLFSAEKPIILLLEDNEKIRNSLQAFLEHMGYTVISSGTVAEAEKYITDKRSRNIALIISDINLHPVSKELEGYAFFRRQTSKDPELPFILISGDYTVYELPAVRAGTVRFLAKPFKLNDLLSAVQSLLGK